MTRSKKLAKENTASREPKIGKELKNVYVDCTANNALFPKRTRVCTYNEDGICTCRSRNERTKKSTQKIKREKDEQEEKLYDISLMLRSIIGEVRNKVGEGPMVVAAGQRVVPLERSLESVLRRESKKESRIMSTAAVNTLVGCTLAKAAAIHQQETERLELGLEPRSVTLDKVEFIPNKRGKGRGKGSRSNTISSLTPTGLDLNCLDPSPEEGVNRVDGTHRRRGKQSRGRPRGRPRGSRSAASRSKSQKRRQRTEPGMSCGGTETDTMPSDPLDQSSSTASLPPSFLQLPLDIVDGCEPRESGNHSLSLPVLSPCNDGPSSPLFPDLFQNSHFSCNFSLGGLPSECMPLQSPLREEIAAFIPIINLVNDLSSESSIPVFSLADSKDSKTLFATEGPDDMKHKSRKRSLKSETPDKEYKRNRSTAPGESSGLEPTCVTQAQVPDQPSCLPKFESNKVSSSLKEDEPSAESMKDCKMDEIPTHQKSSNQKKSHKSKKDSVNKEISNVMSKPNASFPCIKLKDVGKKRDKISHGRTRKDKLKIELPENPIDNREISVADKLGGKNFSGEVNGKPESVSSVREKSVKGSSCKERRRDKANPTFNLICKDRSQEMADKRKCLEILNEGTSSERTYSFKSNITVEVDKIATGRKEEKCASPGIDLKSTDAKKSKKSSKRPRPEAKINESKEKSRNAQSSIKKKGELKVNPKENQYKGGKRTGKTMSMKEKGGSGMVGKSVQCEEHAVSPGSSSGVSSSKSEVSDCEGPGYDSLQPTMNLLPPPERSPHPTNQASLPPRNLTLAFSKNTGSLKFPHTIGSESSSYLDFNLRVTLGENERLVMETTKSQTPSAERIPLDERVVNPSNEVKSPVLENISTTQDLVTLMSPFLTGFEGASKELTSLDGNLRVFEENVGRPSPVCNNLLEANFSSPEETLPYSPLGRSPIMSQLVGETLDNNLPNEGEHLSFSQFECVEGPSLSVNETGKELLVSGCVFPVCPDGLLTEKTDVEETKYEWMPESPMEVEETLSYSPLAGDERLMYSSVDVLDRNTPHPHNSPFPRGHNHPVISNNVPSSDHLKEKSLPFNPPETHIEEKEPSQTSLYFPQQEITGEISGTMRCDIHAITSQESITDQTIKRKPVGRIEEKETNSTVNEESNEFKWVCLDVLDETFYFPPALKKSLHSYQRLKKSKRQRLRKYKRLKLEVPKNEKQKTEHHASPLKEDLILEPPTKKIEREPEFHTLFDSYCPVHLKTNNCLTKDCRLSHSVGDALRGVSGEELWSLVEKLVSGCSQLSVDVVRGVCDALGAMGQRHHLLQLAGRLLSKPLPADYGRSCLSALNAGFHQAQVERIAAAHQILSHLASLSPPPSHQVLEDVVGWMSLDAEHPEVAWRVIECVVSFEGFTVPARVLRHLVGATTRLTVSPSHQFLEALTSLIETVPPQRIVELRILPFLKKLRDVLVSFKNPKAYLADFRLKKVIESCVSGSSSSNCEVSNVTEKSIQPDKPVECVTDQYNKPPLPPSVKHELSTVCQTTSQANRAHPASSQMNVASLAPPGQKKGSIDSNCGTSRPVARLAPKTEANDRREHNWPRNDLVPTITHFNTRSQAFNGEFSVLPCQNNGSIGSSSGTNRPVTGLAAKSEGKVREERNWPRNYRTPSVTPTPPINQLNAGPRVFHQPYIQASQMPTSQTNPGFNSSIQGNNDFNRSQPCTLNGDFEQFLKRVPNLLLMKNIGLIFDGILELCKRCGPALLRDGPRRLLSLFSSQDWFLRMKDLFDIFRSFLQESDFSVSLKMIIRDFIGALGTLKMFDLVEDCSWKSAHSVYCMMQNCSFEEIVYLGPGVGEHMSQLKQILFVCELLFHCKHFQDVLEKLMRYQLLHCDPSYWQVSMEPQEEVLVRQYLTSFLEVSSKSEPSHRKIAEHIIDFIVCTQKSLTAPFDVTPFCMNIFYLQFNSGDKKNNPLKFYECLKTHDKFCFPPDIYRILLITAANSNDFPMIRELFNLCRSLHIYILPEDINRAVEIESYYKCSEMKVYIDECISRYASIVPENQLSSFSFNIKLKENSYSSGLVYLNHTNPMAEARPRLQRALESLKIFYNSFDTETLLVTLDRPTVQQAIRNRKTELSRQPAKADERFFRTMK